MIIKVAACILAIALSCWFSYDVGRNRGMAEGIEWANERWAAP